MSVTSNVFPKAQEALVKAQADLSSDSLKVMLLSAYTYSNTHATMADVLGAGTEASGSGYTAGGQALANVTVSTSGSVTTVDCDDPDWDPSTITAAHAVFYDASGGTDATNLPLVHWDLGGNQSSSDGAFKLTINASGVITLTAS